MAESGIDKARIIAYFDNIFGKKQETLADSTGDIDPQVPTETSREVVSGEGRVINLHDSESGWRK